jgi:outer membrane murein-binding lipoprotein Lpp
MLKYALAGCLALAVVAGFQSWRVERLKTENHDLKQEVSTLNAAVKLGRDDAKEQAAQCTARVDAARASAIRIERIYDRPIHVDPTGCAVRDIVGADELREALQPGLAPVP